VGDSDAVIVVDGVSLIEGVTVDVRLSDSELRETKGEIETVIVGVTVEVSEDVRLMLKVGVRIVARGRGCEPPSRYS